MPYKTIKIPQSTYEQLAKLGTLKDSYGSVIDRLIETSRKQVPQQAVTQQQNGGNS